MNRWQFLALWLMLWDTGGATSPEEHKIVFGFTWICVFVALVAFIKGDRE